MPELERDLRELAAAVAFPETPDLATTVRRSLPERPPSAWPKRLAVVAVVVGIALIAGLAVPQARTALLRFFGIGAVRVELVERLPAVEPGASLALGTRIAAAESPLPVLRSELLGPPDGIYRSGDVVTLLWGSPQSVRLLVTEIGGAPFSPDVVKKLVGSTSSARFASITGSDEPGLWIEGEPHALFLPGAPPRLAANTLLWTSGGLTVRLEGATSFDEAVRIAESLR